MGGDGEFSGEKFEVETPGEGAFDVSFGKLLAPHELPA